MRNHEPSRAALQDVARLWAKAQPVVASFVGGAVRDYHDAEDLVAEVAGVAVAKFPEYDPGRGFTPWVLGIARNVVLRYYDRAAAARAVRLDDAALAAVMAAHAETADEVPARLAALRRCYENVAGTTRRMFDLRYGHGLPLDAVAERLGTTRGAVAVALHRAREALRACIEQRLFREDG